MVKLGQNFLADRNLLEAIVRDAALSPDDVVLEVGAGEGVLTERLAEVARQVHVIEIDRGLEPGLVEVMARPNVNMVWADAVRYDLSQLDPAPTAMVANLPYAVATPVILQTAFELPGIASWNVMVQKEIGDRLRAGPGSKTYGAPSVLIQLAGEVRQVRKVSRTVFRPQPRVDSAIIAIRRTGPGPDPATRRLVRAGSPTAARRWPGRSTWSTPARSRRSGPGWRRPGWTLASGPKPWRPSSSQSFPG